MTYFKRNLIALDQSLHSLCNGAPDETLSAAAFRWELQGVRTWPREFIDLLFFWQEHHCFDSWRSEIERSHLPNYYRRYIEKESQ